MSTPLPITHGCCWASPGPTSSGFLAALPRGAATLWHALVQWQVRRLKGRIADYEPNCWWLP
jgi:hypothetical protein